MVTQLLNGGAWDSNLGNLTPVMRPTSWAVCEGSLKTLKQHPNVAITIILSVLSPFGKQRGRQESLS